MRWADVWQALKAISRGDTQTISMFPLLDQAAPSSPADGSHGGRLHLETRQFGGPHPHSQRVWVAGDAPAAGDAPNRSTMADRIVSFARGLSPRNRLRFDEALEGALDLGALPDVGALEHLQGASHADIYEAAELLHLDRSLPDGGPERTDALQPPTSEVLKRRWHPHMAIKGPMSSAPDEVLEALAQRPDEHIISHIAEEVANGRGIQVLGPAHRLNAVESARLRADYQAHREARIASEENDKARRAEATQRANAERVRSQAERKAERFGLPLARDLVHFAVEKARQGWTIKLVPGAFKDEPFTVEQEPPSRFGLPAPVMHPMDRVLAYCPTRTRTQALRSARALQHDVDTNSRISLTTQAALAGILAAGEGQEWASSPEPGADALKAGPIANRPGLHLDPASHRWTRDVGATLDHIRAAHFEHTRDEGIAAKMPHVRVHQHNPRMGYKGRPPSHLAAAHHEVAGGHTVASALHGAMSVLPFHPSKAEAWDRAQHRYHHAVAAEAWAHVSDKEDQASAREKSKRAEEWDRVIKSRYPTDRARGGRDANDRRTVDLEDLIAMKEAAKAGPIANRPGLHFDATRHRWVANVEHLSGDRQLDKIMREIHQEKADHRNRVLGHMAKGTIEFREPRSDRHALIVPDASEPGRWRFSRFDSGGFAGHRTYDTKHEAAAGAADDGFHEPAPGALDELSSKPEWADGSRRTAISQLDNELRDHPEARRAVFGHFMKHGGSEEAFDRIMHPENLAKLRAGQVPEELKAMAPGRVVLEAWKGGGEFAFLTSAVEGVRFDAPTLSEAAKGLRGDAIRSGAVERAAAAGHPAPKGARWIWLRASNARPDLQGEVVDVAMLKQYADYTVREGGWLDAEHYSRPERFPKWAADQGLTPQSFVLGKITALRFQDEDVWIEGYFYPEGVSTIADDYWNQLQAVPSMFHVSIGGPVLAPRTPVMVDGRRFLKLQMVMNHAALCMQAVNPHGTRVFTGPAGPFSEAMKAGAFAVGDFRDLVQAVVEGVPEQPDCDGESCVACFTRGETLKSVVSGGPDGINEQGIVPQDLEGARDLAPGDDEDEDEGEAQGEEAEKSLFAAGGGFDSPAAAMRYLQACGIPSHLAEQHVGKFWS